MSKEKAFVQKLQNDPKFYFEKILGIETLEKYQEEKILDPIRKYNRVSIAATHSVGKTWTMARIALWFISSFKNSKVITTAPTNRQVEKLLWGELHSAYETAKYPIGGRLLNKELKIGPEWYALGFSPEKSAGTSKEQSGSSFQGFHADYILIIFDEATGITADIHKMAEGLTTSGKVVKWVQIANPTTRACEFYKTFSDPAWFNVYLSCFDSPNLIANGITDIHKLKRELRKLREMFDEDRLPYIESYEKPVPHLLTCQWVMSAALKWGIDHPLFQSKALGKFPNLDDNVLVQLEDVETAINRENITEDQTRYVGVDVARFGEDDTVITVLRDTTQELKKTLSKRDLNEVSGNVVNIVENKKAPLTKILIDATGVGAGVYDFLKDKYRRDRTVEVIEIHFGQSPVMDTDRKDDQDEIKARYLNLKARMFDLLSQDLRNTLSIIDDSSYLEELPTIQYRYNAQGKMQIESKEDYKKRTGNNSPDSSDSLALANLGRYRKSTIGFFSGMKGGKTLNKSRKSSDTISRIEKRIKLNQY